MMKGVYIYAYAWIFQVCKICAFSPEKPTKRQNIYISGRSRYMKLYIIFDKQNMRYEIFDIMIIFEI